MAQEEVQCRNQELNMTVPQKAVIQDCLREAGITSIWKIPMVKSYHFLNTARILYRNFEKQKLYICIVKYG